LIFYFSNGKTILKGLASGLFEGKGHILRFYSHISPHKSLNWLKIILENIFP
jgi:hypothetical protein